MEEGGEHTYIQKLLLYGNLTETMLDSFWKVFYTTVTAEADTETSQSMFVQTASVCWISVAGIGC